MNTPPFLTQDHQASGQLLGNLCQVLSRKPIVLSQLGRTLEAVQAKHRLEAPPDYMHMGRAVVV